MFGHWIEFLHTKYSTFALPVVVLLEFVSEKRWKTTLNAGSFRRYYLQIHLSSRTKKPSIHRGWRSWVRSPPRSLTESFKPTKALTPDVVRSPRSTGGNTTQATTWELTKMDVFLMGLFIVFCWMIWYFLGFFPGIEIAVVLNFMQKVHRIWISRLFEDDFCHPFFHNQKHPQSTSDSNTYGYLGMRGAPPKMAIFSLHHQDDIRFLDTPWKFNINPEKWWLEDYFPFGVAYFQGRTVKLPGGNTIRLGDPEPTFHFKLLLGGGFIPKVTAIIIIHNFLRGKHNLLQERLTKFFTIRRCSCWFWKNNLRSQISCPNKNYVKERTPHFWYIHPGNWTWNLTITQLKRQMIWTKRPFWDSSP